MKIELNTDGDWNHDRLTLIEDDNDILGKVQICIHKDGYDAEDGKSVKVYASDLIRVAKMLSVKADVND